MNAEEFRKSRQGTEATHCARCTFAGERVRLLGRCKDGDDRPREGGFCPLCGVSHANACDECAQAGYHARDCSQSDEPRYMDRPERRGPDRVSDAALVSEARASLARVGTARELGGDRTVLAMAINALAARMGVG